PGIPAEYQSQVFQPFFRLEGSRNVNTGGSGLGLAIVSQLCEIYGWKIYLKSNEHSNGNKGSTFCLMIR
ncbi:MAG: sensor histidine kinase, partial [gamma proteobacterium symbiont of Bathyaustriella thionipta]|nr:sensor histidine kinase [gamma proteobacterium symbiont of Bathyaustriella thionipta]